MATIGAIFAHPDDEVLGAGAALAAHAARGDTVHILILATGLASRGAVELVALDALRDAGRAAANVLGAASIRFADFPDNRMDSIALLDVVQLIEFFLDEVAPTRIFTHHPGDLNVDHRITYQAVVTACRPLPGRVAPEILASEVVSATEWAGPVATAFAPTVFMPSGDSLDRKLRALTCYGSEMRPWPHPRSLDGVRALARWRGTQCGHEAAEAFMLVRRIES